LLGKPASPQPGASTRQTAVERYVQSLVAPHIVDAPHPDKGAMITALDRATSDLMRSILHHPDFQALEAAWRGLDFLMRNVELDAGVDVFLLDLSRNELASELASGSDSPLHRQLIATGVPWSLIVGDYTFAPTQPDVSLLGALAQWLAPGEAPLLAGADYRVFSGAVGGEDENPLAWEALRKSADAAGIGLAMPRFLLRVPYGARTDPISRFAFEEQPDTPDPERFLWGNPAYFVACLLGQSFVRSGWGFSADETLEMSGLPVFTAREGGEVVQTPGAEVWMGIAEAEALVTRGFIPLCAVRGRDAVRLLRVQSIATPPAPLAARWG
jgi:type VI secretion system protein ImpC